MTGSTIPKSTTATAPAPDTEDLQRTIYPDTRTHTLADTHGELRQTMQERTEPSWSDAPTQVSPEGGYDWMRQAAAAQEDTQAWKRKWTLRIVVMAGIFVVGAGAGMIGAKWFNPAARVPVVTTVKKEPPTPAAPAKPSEGKGARGAAIGISPSELPYDGAAPPDQVGSVRATPDRSANPDAAKSVQNVQSVTPERAKTKSLVANGSTSGDSRAAVMSSGSSASEDVQEQLRESRKENASRYVPKAASRTGGDDRGKVSAAPKREPQPKSAKDREIERMKQQADEELKKKPEHGRLSNRKAEQAANRQSRRRSPVTMRTASASNLRTQVAQCERASNIFQREHCRWQLCAGIWGKNGCPYYPPPSNLY